MASRIYSAYNGASVTSAAPVKVTTSAAIKTLQVLSPSSTMALEVIEWGISFDGSAAATPGVCELLDVTAQSIAHTVTAYAAADIVALSGAANKLATGLTLGTANSGFTASAEGTITTTKQMDTQLLPPTAPYIKQFPLERGPEIFASEFLRVRVTFGTAINALCYIVWAE